jgi:Rrf2 family protein
MEVSMKLSNAARYALEALVYLAAQRNGGTIASHIIAEAEGIPERFLLKVLKPLVSARILQSLKGPNGGYRLAKPTKAITLLEVVEAVDGPIRGQVSFEGQDSKGLESFLQGVCDEAAVTVRRHYQKVRLADLAKKR